ncbi:MAG: aldo/keto reductase [Gammaproteobacteria bacterium]|nr:aldo/keto reductase [Gammaproteobacteria bacterium]
MNKIKLGDSNIEVTEVCLGSMTWGQQNTQDEAFEQLYYAIDERGINFIDTAEMYSVPPAKETAGSTETFIGNWFAANPGKREELVLATKIAGSGIPWIRNGGKIVGEAILPAIDASLQRLQTDYIDLYQLHWPNRTSPHFSRHWPGAVDPTSTDVEQDQADMLGVLQALDEAVKAGKIRACGLSNETPWGIAEYARIAEQHALPKMVSIQNEFSLLHLKDWPYLIEACIHNNVAYLPWSPLAGGALSGKYANGNKPKGARWTMVQRNGVFRDTTYSHAAIAEYQKVADRFKLSLTQMCLAWVYQFTGVTSTIIGATTVEQLKEDINAHDLVLSAEVLAAIDEVIKKYPVPF